MVVWVKAKEKEPPARYALVLCITQRGERVYLRHERALEAAHAGAVTIVEEKGDDDAQA